MGFKSETHLVDLLKDVLLRTYNNQEMISILDEVSVGFGIADLVVSVKSNEKETRGGPILNLIDTYNYCFIQSSNKSLEINEIISTTRISISKTRKSLKKLVAAGYLELQGDKYSLAQHYTFSSSLNFAIEAKLKNWRRALEQAFRYKWFAEYSFVVLDEKFSKPAIRNISMFKKYKVGLATISTNGKLVKHFVPELNSPLDTKMQILLSERVKMNF